MFTRHLDARRDESIRADIGSITSDGAHSLNEARHGRNDRLKPHPIIARDVRSRASRRIFLNRDRGTRVAFVIRT